MSMDNLKKNLILTPFNLLYKINPNLVLKILFRLKLGYNLDLENPVTYNEKLQWIKLYDKNPLITKCCDKYEARQYIKSCGCEDILNELFWEGFNPEDIPFDELPQKFVIKVTHGSTFNIICTNKDELNIEKTIKQLTKWLKAEFLPCYGEWFYGIERPRIIIERYLEGDMGLPLFDYKFFCFNGEPKLIYINTWRNGHYNVNVYDTDFNLLDGVNLGYENDTITVIEKPSAFEQMKNLSRVLSKDFLHVRVDFYYTHGKIYFGELTFTRGAGFGKINPYEFDVKMGSWLKLPPVEA